MTTIFDKMKKAKLHRSIFVLTLMLVGMSTASASPQIIQDTVGQQRLEEGIFGYDDEYILNGQNALGGKGDGANGGAKSEGTPGEYTLFNQQFGVDVANNGQGGYDLRNQTFGIQLDDMYAPLGSGCFILMAAGAFYAFRKRRKEE